MPQPIDQAEQREELADPNWFREPTRREHIIAAAIFIGFGLFFFLFSFVWVDRWFRWAIVGLSVISVLYGLGHARDARRVEK
jgi:hypothetical protein